MAFRGFARPQKQYPLAILVTARAEEAELPLDDLAYQEIYLGHLTRDNLAQALAQTPPTQPLARFHLLLAREDARAALAARDAQAQDLAALAQLATALDDNSVDAAARQAEVAMRLKRPLTRHWR